MTYRPGAIVQLKSGGPAMTVVGPEKEGIRCVWYSEADGQIHSTNVPSICLDEILLDDEDDGDEDL